MTQDIELFIERLLAAGETESVEFKESFDNEAIESIAAFANTGGGTLLIGVADDGAVRGVRLGKETLREWANQIAQAAHIHPEIRELLFGERTIVVIEVSESSIKPVPCRGRYYKRVGKSNRQMSDDDLTRAVLDKVGMTWDQVIERRARLEDLNLDQLRRFRKLCNLKGRRLIPEEEDNAAVLDKLGLLSDGQLTRAAVLLFAKEPQRFYPSAFIKIGRFRSPTLIVDDREIYGTLLDQVDGVMGYFREHLQTRFEFTGEIAREVIWEYPLEALREAITNAVCHRDYIDVGNTQMRWYDEQLVFLNPGGLPSPLRLEELKGPHRSVPRNRLIAEMFFYLGWIERWGSGIQKILSECAAAGLPEPDFDEKQGALWVTFYKDIFTEDQLRAMGLNERQVRAVLLTREKGRITNKAYQQLCQVSARTATRDLTDLVRKSIVEQVGETGKGTFYRLKTPETRQRRHEDATNRPNG